MNKHTHGPWRLVNTSDGFMIAGADPGYLATTRGRFALKARSEEESNARLIAAALELLDALQALFDWGIENTGPRDANSPHDLLVAAQTALAKARED